MVFRKKSVGLQLDLTLTLKMQSTTFNISAMHLPKRLIPIILLLSMHAHSSASTALSTLPITSLENIVEHEPDNLEARYQLGIRYHHAAQTDCEASLDKALEQFKYVYTADASRQEARAFYGSATVLKAKYVGLFSKLKYAREGFAILDATAEQNPDNFKVRLVRAANAANCPGFLGRSDIAEQDLNWLLNTIDTHPQGLSQESIKIALFYAGHFAMKNKDKRCLTLLEQSIKINSVTTLDPKIEAAYLRAQKKFGNSKTRERPRHRSF